MLNSKTVVAVILSLVGALAAQAGPLDVESPKYLKLSHNGAFGSEIWELTVHEDGTVVFLGALRGQYRAAKYRISPDTLTGLREAVRLLNETVPPQYYMLAGTDSPDLIVREFLPDTGITTHGVGLNGKLPKDAPREAKIFMRWWSRVTKLLEVPELELPFAPKHR